MPKTSKTKEIKAKRQKVQPATPSEPDRIIQLPVELLIRILQRADKPTLAICMRVSSHFNALAAPVLYKSIHITRHYPKHPFARPEGLDDTVPRLSPAKSELLKLVDQVTIDAHNGGMCGNAIGSLHNSLDDYFRYGSWMRVNMTSVNSPGFPQDFGRPHLTWPYGGPSRCNMFHLFAAKRLVLDGVSAKDPFPSHATGLRHVESLTVFVRDGTRHFIDDGYHDMIMSPIREAVLIIMPCPSGFPSWSCKYTPETGCWIELLGTALRKAIDSHLATDYTIVNLGSDDTVKLRRCLEAARRDDEKTAMDAIRYINMGQYLTTHNWSGVFTREEADEWLKGDEDVDAEDHCACHKPGQSDNGRRHESRLR